MDKFPTFVNVGMSNVVQAARIILICKPGTRTAKLLVQRAKDEGRYHDARLGRPFKSIVMLDDGTIIASCIKPLTLMRRFNNPGSPIAADADEKEELEELEEEDEEEAEDDTE